MTQNKKPGFGILSVQTEVLANALCLPEGYRIVGIAPDPRFNGVNLLLTSDKLPEVPEGQEIPLVSLYCTVHRLPEVPPEYCHVTVEVVLL